MLKQFLTLLFISLLNFAWSQKTYNPSIDILNYTFDISISDTDDNIIAIADINLIVEDINQDILIDLVSKGENEKGMTVSSITSNGTSLPFSHVNDQVKFSPLSSWKNKDTTNIKISYKGIPADGLIISENKYGERTFFGDNWPNRAHNYLPVVDHPSDKAYVSFKITAPHHYEVISNGMLVERSYLDPINTLTQWQSKTTIPTKVMVFAAANFSTSYLGKVGCVPVTAWVFHQNRKEGFSDYHPSVEALQYFNDKIGDYPYHKLANVQSKTRYGGMENASCIFYYENSVNGKGTVDDLIAHEIAHQWFGNSVSEQEWEHIWLSEGFATYLADLFMKKKYGDDKFHERLQGEKKKALSFAKKYPMPIIASNITNLNQLLSPNSYQRAAWVLHMYHNKVGDDIFWNTLSNYYSAYKDGNATTAQFIAIATKSADKDMTDFFMQWLDRPDYPILEISTKEHKGNTEILVEQIQDGDAFQLDIPISISTNGKANIINIKTNGKTTKYLMNGKLENSALDLSKLNDIFCEWARK